LLVYQKSPQNRLEVRIYGPRILNTLSRIAFLFGLINVALGVVFENWLYFLVAAGLFAPAIALFRVYRGRVMYVEKTRGKVLLHPGVVEKGEPRKLEWPEMELTEARMLTRQVFVGREKETRILVGVTRRSLKPTLLVETDSLEEAVEFGLRLCRVLRCEIVDATISPPVRVPYEQLGALRKRLTAEMEEGERTPRPAAVSRQRKGGGYEYRWKRQNSRGVVFYGVVAAVLTLSPLYLMQLMYVYWPMLMWIPAAGLVYLAFFEWATLYTLTMDPQSLTYVDGKRANDPRKVKWEVVRGVRRLPGAGTRLELRTLRPFPVECGSPAVAAYLEEQIGRFMQRYGAGVPGGRDSGSVTKA
jgi:hypothetical protein